MLVMFIHNGLTIISKLTCKCFKSSVLMSTKADIVQYDTEKQKFFGVLENFQGLRAPETGTFANCARSEQRGPWLAREVTGQPDAGRTWSHPFPSSPRCTDHF